MGAPALTQPDAPTFLPDAVPPEALPPEPPVAPDPYGRPNIMPDATPVAAGESLPQPNLPYGRPSIAPDAAPVAAGDMSAPQVDPLGPPAIQPDAQPVAIPEPQPAQPPPAKPVEPSKPAKVTIDQKQEFASPIQDSAAPTTPPIVAKSSAKDITPDTTPQVTADKPIAEMALEKIASAKIPVVSVTNGKNGSVIVRSADPANTKALTIVQNKKGEYVIMDGNVPKAKSVDRQKAIKAAAEAIDGKRKFGDQAGDRGAVEGGLVEDVQAAADKAASYVKKTIADVHEATLNLFESGASLRAGLKDAQTEMDAKLDSVVLGVVPLGTARKMLTFPRTMAEKYPSFRPIYEHATNVFSHITRTANQLGNLSKPYMKLNDASRVRVNSILEADRLAYAAGRPIDTSNKALAAKGFSPEEMIAYKSIRDTYDHSLDILGQALKDKAYNSMADSEVRQQIEAGVDEFITKAKNTHYVPFGRWGDKYLRILDKEGNTVSYQLFENASEWKTAIRTAKKEHGPGMVDANQLRKPVDGTYSEMPVNFMHDFYYKFVDKLPDNNLKNEMKAVVSSMTKPQGFGSHLVKADLTPGYSRDFRRATADYIVGLSHFSAQSKYAPLMREAVSKIGPTERALKTYAEQYVKNLSTPNPALVAGLQKFMAAYYLSRPWTAALNLTQIGTTTMPEAWNRLGTSGLYKKPGAAIADATWIGAKAARDAGEYLAKRAQGKKLDSEVGRALDAAVGDGIVSEQMYRDFVRMKDGTKQENIVHYATAMFRGAEVFNRTHAFVTGHQIGKKLGLAGEKLQAYAEDFVKTTQFDMSSANKPQIATSGGALGSLGRLAFTFRSYEGNMIRFLRDGGGKNWRKGVGNVAAIMALGGAAALPGGKGVIKALEGFGSDPRGRLKKAIEEDSEDSAMLKGAAFGVPHLLGFASLGGSLGSGDWVPEVESNPLVGVAKLGLGVSANLGLDAYKAYDALKNNRPMKAAQAAAPSLLKGSLKALEAYQKDAFTTGRGEVLLEKPTATELGVTALGGTPPRLADEYIDTRSKQLIKNKVTAARGNHNEVLGQYLADGDIPGFKKYMNEILQKSAEAAKSGDYASIYTPDMESIMANLMSRKSKAGADLKWWKSIPKTGKVAAIKAGVIGEDDEEED
jgi:hypothetical protein